MLRAYEWHKQELLTLTQPRRKWRLRIETAPEVQCPRCGGQAVSIGQAPDRQQSLYHCRDCQALLYGDCDLIEAVDEND